jgi:undecaprenyl diphosphate synthase
VNHLVPDALNLTTGAGVLPREDEASCQTRPNHVAIIMDGNGRWAKSRGKVRSDGHRAGTDNIRAVIETFDQNEVKYLTLFAFSTENWHRPTDEVQTLIEIMREAIIREVRQLHEQGVRIRHLGRLDRLSEELQEAILDSVELTRQNTGMTLSVAFDYGGRDEIINAIRRIVADNIPAENITEEILNRYLHTSELPDPDLIIRTAGEMRMSNFLLWQSAYAEYYATPVLWPDFDKREALKALEAYGQRQRRFGKVAPEEK